MKDPNATDLDDLVQKGLSTTGMKQLLDMVAQYSWWVPRQVYEKVPVVYPKTRRKGSKERRGMIDDSGNRLWLNEPAIVAFWRACDKGPRQMKNYFICHIYEGSVKDPSHFTNLANLTAFPKSIQSLSEWGPVAAILKYHSFKEYGYTGPFGIEPSVPDYFPTKWPYQVNLSPLIVTNVVRHLEEQRRNRPQFRTEVRNAEQTKELPGSVQPLMTAPTVTVIGTISPNKDDFARQSYVKGITCKKMGLEHEYVRVAGKNWAKCQRCNSTRTIKPTQPTWQVQ